MNVIHAYRNELICENCPQCGKKLGEKRKGARLDNMVWTFYINGQVFEHVCTEECFQVWKQQVPRINKWTFKAMEGFTIPSWMK